jgi:uncharacterized protein YciW
MCSYTRDPHLRPKAAPLPPLDVASHKKQLHSVRRYKSSLDVLLAILQSAALSSSYTTNLAVECGLQVHFQVARLICVSGLDKYFEVFGRRYWRCSVSFGRAISWS